MTKRKNIWRGSYYLRQKQFDKHGNRYNTKPTLRQKSTGIVVDKFGNFKGFERPHKHVYGTDIHKGKKPKGWHGESVRHSFARRGIRTKR